MTDLAALLDTLERTPDVGTVDQRAWDAADRYLLDYAASEFPDAVAGEVAVVDDTHGALALGALALGARGVRVHQDSLVARRALAGNAERAGLAEPAQHPLASLVTPATSLVLVRLPRSLDRLDAIARSTARAAGPDVVVLAAGRLKHMTPTQNEVLARAFARVDVTHARAKSRILVAREPRPDVTLPLAFVARLELRPGGGGNDSRREGVSPAASGAEAHTIEVVALPGVFAGPTLDIGTRALLDTFDELPPFERAIDLACGTGIVAALLARRNPDARILATDVSEIAVESARLTAEANGVRVDAHQDDGLSGEPDASADLVVLNPPFHAGAAVTTEIAHRLFADAARVLRPGGELRVVWNSHLGYRPVLERLVGPTRQLSRTPKFTVTVSRRR
ncbi:methyltransferase [Protaetiibacter sp. SSC-01]|uniref:class I SAM-dependent methyltransferase n=1 Tax=Protaetiibacter sp. SSC-01 TaxID=2759943 RepID=UPI0016572007|nr:class I SAM-dependent methyltransferase [Protaetiibacter sp. SSC-01]QNO37732.1 methyltransferase [Protaetiibacter sp. SSC-01]